MLKGFRGKKSKIYINHEKMKPLFFYIHILLVSFLFIGNAAFAQSSDIEQKATVDSAYILLLLEKNDLPNAETALRLAKEIEFENGKLLALPLLAELHKKDKNIALSLRYALEYLNLIDKKALPKKQLTTVCFIGDIYFEEKLFSNALDYYRLATNETIQNPFTEVNLWEKMGEAYQQNLQLDSALIFFKKAGKFYRETGNFPRQISNIKLLAEVYEQQNNCQKALEQNLTIQQLLTKKGAKLLPTTANNIGYNYHCLQNFELAIENFKQAENLCELEECSIDKTALQANLSIAYFNNSDFNNGLRHLEKAINLAKSDKNLEKVAELTHLKATVFFQRKDFYQAQIFNQDAIRLSKKNNFSKVLQDSYQLAARIYQELYEFEPALEFYEKHLSLKDSLLLEERLRQQELLQQQFFLERSEKEIKLLLVNQKVQDLSIRELERQQSILRLQAEKLSLESNRKENELSLLRQEQEIKEERLKTQELEAARSKQQLLLTRQQLDAAEKDRSIAELRQKEEAQQRAIAEQEAQQKERDAEIENLKNLQEIDRLAIKEQEARSQLFLSIGFGLLAILGLILFGFLNARKKSRQLAQQNKEIEAQKSEIEQSHNLIEEERTKSENLLLNILPAETAKELKEKGVATPQLYENVSVLFTDFIGFTHISKKMPPAEVIQELNTCFLAFDEIIEEHNLEKIKTIGDAYMCAGGVPKKDPKSANNAIKAALKMQQYIEKRYAQKTAAGKNYWQMRVGIHCGNVVAGVVGSKKFAYDIWGDTVNLASRMENSSKAGRVNISATTYEKVKEDFDCEFRGVVEVKNRGKVGMYFVE